MRSHYSIEIGKKLEDEKIIVAGWVNSIRDHGGVYFIDLRDSKGIVQIVANPRLLSKHEYEQFHSLRDEWVIEVEGIVELRGEGLSNPNLITGDIEIRVSEIKILSKAKTLPFKPGDKEVNSDIKLEYRYLELRNKELQDTLKMRSKISMAIRNFLTQEDYNEIETPILIKSSEGGAEEVYATSKLFPTEFYSLPQSPQMYKQMLMVGGFEKYYSFAKCFRAESARSDRNIEFTQIDIERAFSDRKGIMYDVSEIFKKSIEVSPYTNIDKKNANTIETLEWLKDENINAILEFQLNQLQILQLTYKTALNSFGSDKPDLRFKMPLLESKDLFINTNFEIFSKIAKSNNTVIKSIVAKQSDFPEKLSKRKIKDLEKFVNGYGAKGLAYFQCKEENGKVKLKGPLDKFLKSEDLELIANKCKLEIGDIIFFGAGDKDVTLDYMGRLRIELARQLNIIPEDKFVPLWVTDFPLFEKSSNGSWKSVHHPFTAPEEQSWNDYLNNYTLEEEILSDSYDLVLNGVELGGGSIRIHNPELQSKIFEILKLSKEDIENKFGFFTKSLSFGTPPHGGFAFGFSRLIMLLLKKDSIREVIAFPKNQSALCPMTNAPDVLDNEKQKELGIRFRN